MPDRWLDTANSADLESLAQSLRDRRLAPPFHKSAVQQAGMPEAAEWFSQWSTTPPDVLAWTLERLARERRAAEMRYSAVASLVWSGASEDDQAARDTRIVMNELFARADKSVLISTFVIYNGKVVFESLTDRLRAKPGLEVELFVNLRPDDCAGDERAAVSNFLDVFRRDHWPDDLELPAIYYDPENLKPGKERVTLHAKCVVVDHRWAFITSANFTEAAQERNIEAGVLLDHPGIATAVAGRFRGLKEAGRLRRMGASGVGSH